MNPLDSPAAYQAVTALPPGMAAPGRTRRIRRVLLWAALVALLLVAQSLLVWLTLRYESAKSQEQVEVTAGAVAADIKQNLGRVMQSLQALLWNDPPLPQWRADAADLLRGWPAVLRIEWRNQRQEILTAVDSPFRAPIFTRIARRDIELETELACVAAARLLQPSFSRSYFVPLPDGLGLEVVDVCIPVQTGGRTESFMTATLSLSAMLGDAASSEQLREHEISFVEGDGTRLARVGVTRGAGVYMSERLVDLPGNPLQLRADSRVGGPRLIPNLAVALVLGLSLTLGVVVALLVRDVRKRAGAEAALAEALAFRKAMEDSLVTGLRARDLEGRITYVNPAFCKMVGFPADSMLGRAKQQPYWPPDLAEEYARRQAMRLARQGDESLGRALAQEAREGFETLFMRSNGERFSVLIFEAPLVDGSGRQTGWMSAVLDVSQQRRVEELSRQQQERLAATARLATVGEMASLLSHELNQPLAAIASYATGSLNLMEPDDQPLSADTLPMLKQALQRIAEQAERAGRVIKSVHDFVRRREQAREPTRVDALIDAVLPLVRLQARKSGARVEVAAAPELPRVVCDRTMVEQVLLNLTRNGIQAMDDEHTPMAQRELQIRVTQQHAGWVHFHVIDRGPGVTSEVARRLFTPFFTTRSEGMGLGLSLCRTVVEQHGGALDFRSPAATGSTPGLGTVFSFSLPAETAPKARRQPHPAPDLASFAADLPQPHHGPADNPL
jgi:two-component system sensor histidine kinase DctS